MHQISFQPINSWRNLESRCCCFTRRSRSRHQFFFCLLCPNHPWIGHFSPLLFLETLMYERFLSGGRHSVRWQPLFINIFSAWWRIDFTLQMINWVPMFYKSMLAWTHTRWQRLFFLRHRETITQHFCRVCQVYSSSQWQYYSSCKWSVVSSDYTLDYTLENTEGSFWLCLWLLVLWIYEFRNKS